MCVCVCIVYACGFVNYKLYKYRYSHVARRAVHTRCVYNFAFSSFYDAEVKCVIVCVFVYVNTQDMCVAHLCVCECVCVCVCSRVTETRDRQT